MQVKQASPDLEVPERKDSQHTTSNMSKSRLSAQKTPKIRKVNGYIIFYDEVIGQGQFGTVVKA